MGFFRGLIFPENILITHSRYSDDIRIVRRNAKLELWIDGVVQTSPKFMERWKNVYRVFNLKSVPADSILILGIGGGDLLRLSRSVFPESRIVAVDIDRKIIDLACRYFQADRYADKLHVQNAMSFVEKNIDRNYDLIFVDLYRGNLIPDFVSSDRFLMHAGKCLSQKGRLVISYADGSASKGQKNSLLDKMPKFFHSVTRYQKGPFCYYCATFFRHK